MWIGCGGLRRLGFRQRSEGYWQCERGHGLPAGAYLSIFSHADDGSRVEVWAFHVTFRPGIDRVHFYYHDAGEDGWEPGGHTSAGELRRYGLEPRELREAADAVAARLAAALGGALLPRDE